MPRRAQTNGHLSSAKSDNLVVSGAQWLLLRQFASMGAWPLGAAVLVVSLGTCQNSVAGLP